MPFTDPVSPTSLPGTHVSRICVLGIFIVQYPGRILCVFGIRFEGFCFSCPEYRTHSVLEDLSLCVWELFGTREKGM